MKPSPRAALLAWTLCLACAPAAAQGLDLPATSTATDAGYGIAATPPPARPVAVIVRLWAYDLGRIDVQDGTCEFDGSLELGWPDGAQPRPGDPRPFEIMNAIDARIEDYGMVRRAQGIVQVYRVHATLRVDVDLRRYPFDAQRLAIQLEHPTWTAEHFRFVPETQADPRLDLRKDRLGADAHLRDWQIASVRDGASEHRYAEDEVFSRYAFAVEVRRSLLPFLVGELGPILLMVLLGLGAAFVPGDKIDAKLLLTVLALLVAVELQVGTREHAPQTGYLVLTDWLYLLAYISIAMAIAQSIAEYRLHAVGRDDLAVRVKHWGLGLAAAVFALPALVLTLLRLG